jgi:serine/threonine protein kinase
LCAAAASRAQVMNCGDQIYRSTLDPKLRLEEARSLHRPRRTRTARSRRHTLTRRCSLRATQAPFITGGGAAILLAVGAYLSITPGAGAGFLDYFALAPLALARQPRYSLDDFVFVRKLGEGGFGDVYQARLERPAGGGPPQDVVLKCARGFGEEEVWMNGRTTRACPTAAAAFITSFRDARQPVLPRESGSASAGAGAAWGLSDLSALSNNLANDLRAKWDAVSSKPAAAAAPSGGAAPPPGGGAAGGDPLWLVWQLEGTQSLADVINAKDFPYSAEPALFGAPLTLPPGPARKAATMRLLLRQMLGCIAALHATGIVHRDVKPENFVLVTDAKASCERLKIIDLGAAADLRVGINYVPREYLLDPRYAAPEQYIMSTQTPVAPPVPVALLLSPALWQLNLPDRFDLYAVGLVLLQMALPPLRGDSSLVAFRRALDANGHDLDAWRETYERRALRDCADGWAALDADNGAGWDLVRKLVRVPASARPSAAAALRHPFVAGAAAAGGAPAALMGVADGALAALTANEGSLGRESAWVLRRMARSGTQREGGFTEAQMERITDLARPPTASEARNILGRAMAAQTEAGEFGGGEGGAAGGGSGRVQARRKPLPMRRETRTVAQAAREAVVRAGVMRKLNFWGDFSERADGDGDGGSA